jgi:hypothetical protein
VIDLKIFVGGEYNAGDHVPAIQERDAKEGLFRVVNAFDMNGVVPVIGEGLHGIEEDPEDDEHGESQDEPAGGIGNIIQQIEQSHEEELICFKAYEPG